MKKCFLAGLVMAGLGACAQTQVNENAEIPKQKEYRTGSNLPVGERDKSGVTVADPDAAQDLMRRRGADRRPGSGS